MYFISPLFLFCFIIYFFSTNFPSIDFFYFYSTKLIRLFNTVLNTVLFFPQYSAPTASVWWLCKLQPAPTELENFPILRCWTWNWVMRREGRKGGRGIKKKRALGWVGKKWEKNTPGGDWWRLLSVGGKKMHQHYSYKRILDVQSGNTSSRK